MPEAPGLSPPVAVKPSVPREVRFAWISPRGTATIADIASAHLTSSYFLHSVLTSIELPLNAFSTNSLVAFDVPATYSPKFEQALLKAVSKIRRMGPHVVVFVQPSLRKKTTVYVIANLESVFTYTHSLLSDMFVPAWKWRPLLQFCVLLGREHQR